MADTPATPAKTFLFMPESAYGPTNNCIGIGNELRRRGHRVVFAAEASWEGRLDALGFVEDLVHLSEPPPADAPEQSAGQFWTDFIRDTAPEFRKPTIDQLTTFVQPTWQALIDGAMYCEPQLREIIARQRPDVIIEDNVNCFPALLTGGVPFVRMASCNPLEVRGPDVPPVFSGYASDDRTGWDEFRAEYDRTHRPMWQAYDEWVRSCGAPGLLDLDFIHTSDHLNLYLYPEVVDYTDRRPLDDTWTRLDSSVRGDRPSVRDPPATPRRRGFADLPVARFARLRRCRPDAPARRRAGPHEAPVHREQGAAGRRVRPGRQHVGVRNRCRRPRCSRSSTS